MTNSLNPEYTNELQLYYGEQYEFLLTKGYTPDHADSEAYALTLDEYDHIFTKAQIIEALNEVRLDFI